MTGCALIQGMRVQWTSTNITHIILYHKQLDQMKMSRFPGKWHLVDWEGSGNIISRYVLKT